MCFCYYFYDETNNSHTHTEFPKSGDWDRFFFVLVPNWYYYCCCCFCWCCGGARKDMRKKSTTTIDREIFCFICQRGKQGRNVREKRKTIQIPKCMWCFRGEWVKEGGKWRRCENLVRQKSFTNSFGKRLSFWNRLRHKSLSKNLFPWAINWKIFHSTIKTHQ